MGRFVVESLGKDHDRAAFACGVESLDIFIHRLMGQYAERQLATPFLLVDTDVAATRKTVAGYYTLSANALNYLDLPDPLRRGAPQRIQIGVTLLGRLAVDLRYRGQGLGTLLLLDAFKRSLDASKHVASRAVITDAIDDTARSFYERHDFVRFADDSYRLYLSMETIARMFRP